MYISTQTVHGGTPDHKLSNNTTELGTNDTLQPKDGVAVTDPLEGIENQRVAPIRRDADVEGASLGDMAEINDDDDLDTKPMLPSELASSASRV